MSRAVHAFIDGRVQRVGYRNWTVDEAQRLGLAGWVRNLSDGRVEAVFAGDDEIVAEMLELCRQGPRWARVDEIETHDVAGDDAPVPFERRPNA